MADETYTKVQAAEDATEDVLRLAETVFDSWFANEPRIDWEAFWERMERWTLPDGSYPEIPEDDSPAVRKIKRHIAEYRREG